MSSRTQSLVTFAIVAFSGFLVGRFFPTSSATAPQEMTSEDQCQQQVGELQSKIDEIITLKGEDCRQLLATQTEHERPTTGQETASHRPATGPQTMPPISSEKEAEEFLNEVAEENFFQTIKSAIPVRAESLNILVGRFEGTINWFDTNQRPLEVRLELELHNSMAGKENGKYRIQLFKDGVKISDTAGEGGFPDFQSFDQASPGILVKTSPKTYMQIFWVERLNQFTGNYYNQEALDNYARAGTVFLRRL